MFTKELIEEIKNKLMVFSKKDVELPEADTVTVEDIITIVQGGQNKQLTIEKFLESEVAQAMIADVVAELRIQELELKEFAEYLESILADIEVATGVSPDFGLSQSVGISQKTLTDVLRRIWEKFEDITGEPFMGINMVVSPNYFISEGNVDVDIIATSRNAVGQFEKISFYKDIVDDEHRFFYGEHLDDVEVHTTIDSTTNIICQAIILGIEYTDSKIITHYNEFWIGGGMSAVDVKIDENAQLIENGTIKGNYDVTVEEGQHIILIFAESLAEEFVRADMNGIEIPMTRSIYTVGDTTYVVFTSDDTYIGGTYNIDINS